MPIRTDWTLDEIVMPEDMNDIGKELNRLREEDKNLDNKKFDKTGGTVNGSVNATNLQVGGNNVYHTNRKPTPADIGASPIGHSHDDRYFTEAEMNEKLKTKVSVESGKGLSTNDYTTAEKNKLAGIAAGANAYTHPSSHPATMITEDSTHRFVTDVEKQDFNNKISKDDYEVGSNGTCKTLDSRNDIRLINKSGKYSGINVTGNPTGTDAFYFYDVECMSNDVRIVTAKTAGSPLRIFVGSYISEWLGWKEVFNVDKKPTPSEIGALGATAKAESAKTADAVAWANVTGKPSSFTPSSHTHTKSQITDMPTALKNPTAVKVQLNGGTTEGTNQFTYDGSAAKTINVTPANIGALPSGGTAANALKLNGAVESASGTGNTIARRDSNGDLSARLMRSSYANQSSIGGALAFRENNGSDNFIRFCSDAQAILNWLGTNKAKYEMLGTATKFDIVMPNPNANFIRCTFSCGNKQELSSIYVNVNGKYVTDWTVGASFSMVIEFMKVSETSYVMSMNLHCAMRNSDMSYRLTTSTNKLDYASIQKITFEHSQAGYKLENCAYTLEWY